MVYHCVVSAQKDPASNGFIFEGQSVWRLEGSVSLGNINEKRLERVYWESIKEVKDRYKVSESTESLIGNICTKLREDHIPDGWWDWVHQ